HHPHPVHGRRPAGQLRPPRHPHGAGPPRLRPLAGDPHLRPERSELAESGSLRPVRRPRVHAAVLRPPPGRGQTARPERQADGWNTLHVADANDRGSIAAALEVAKGTTDRPTIIILDSHIGYGAPKKQDTSDAHGEPLGEEAIKGAKRNYGWPENEKFVVPDGV